MRRDKAALGVLAVAVVVVGAVAVWAYGRDGHLVGEGNSTSGSVSVTEHQAGDIRPYSLDSPWNTPIPDDIALRPGSDVLTRRLASAGPFGSDPDQYTYPVYVVDHRLPLTSVQLAGKFTAVAEPDVQTNLDRPRIEVPIPDGATPSAGSDASMIIWNVETGDEWGFWQLQRATDGSWSGRNGYHYNIAWSGVPRGSDAATGETGFVSRGAGIPYFAGLVRRWELERRSIDHALAFAYNRPSPSFVYPATKSDGLGDPAQDLPEGARLQLDPSLTDADFARWGLDDAGMVIARALQKYGMIVVDTSGHPKVMVEARTTAGWGGSGAPVVSAATVAPIPLAAFRVIDWERWTGGPNADGSG